MMFQTQTSIELDRRSFRLVLSYLLCNIARSAKTQRFGPFVQSAVKKAMFSRAASLYQMKTLFTERAAEMPSPWDKSLARWLAALGLNPVSARQNIAASPV
jgi:hypothetical protein